MKPCYMRFTSVQVQAIAVYARVLCMAVLTFWVRL